MIDNFYFYQSMCLYLAWLAIGIFFLSLGKCLEKIEISIKETQLKDGESKSKEDTNKDKICEKVGQMKTILHELSSSYPINDRIVLPPNEINTSNMESYVGKPKYLKDR